MEEQKTERMTVTERSFNEELAKYPDSLLRVTGVSDDMINVSTVLDRMFESSKGAGACTTADMSTDPNANIGNASYATILQECHKGALKRYALKEIYKKAWELWDEDTAKRLLKKEIEGELYFSDLHLFTAPYCYNFTANWLMYKGLPFVPRIPSQPAKHLDTFLQHAAQLITFASNHQSGACALAGFFTACDWYVRKDNMTNKKHILQLFQEFTYTMNQPFRFSNQTPFLNLTLFDRYYLQELYGEMAYPDGTYPVIDSIIALQKMYAEWLMEEVRTKGIIFTFPVLTVACLTDSETKEPKDQEFFDWATKTNAAFGMFNFYFSDNAGSISSCCRLSNDINKLRELGYVNSFGAGGDGIGSTGVVTVNLPHVFLQAMRDGRDPWEELEESVKDAQKASYIRKCFVKENMPLLPLYQHGFIDINSQYCTVGICGMYEAARAYGALENSLTNDNVDGYVKFASKVLDKINNLNVEASKIFHEPFNLEQVPAEGQAVTLAKKDMLLGLQNDAVIYSNQWIPLAESGVDVYKRIKLAGILDRACSGGAILHITTGTKVSAEVQKRLLTYCARMGVVYCAFNYTLSKCSCGAVVCGDISRCPECGGTNIDIYTRVVGFITPVRQWHAVRRDEFRRRKRYDLDARQKEMLELKAQEIKEVRGEKESSAA